MQNQEGEVKVEKDCQFVLMPKFLLHLSKSTYLVTDQITQLRDQVVDACKEVVLQSQHPAGRIGPPQHRALTQHPVYADRSRRERGSHGLRDDSTEAYPTGELAPGE